jgi:hypothetical protein
MKRTLRRLAALASLLALTLGLHSCGDDSMGPDDGDVDHTIEFPTDVADLQMAIDQAEPGDTVLVAAGSHTITTSIQILSSQAGITLLGAKEAVRGAERPILNFTLTIQKDALTVNAQNVRVEGIEFTGTFSTGVVFSKADGVLTNCVVNGGLRYGVACTQPESDTLIERNILRNAGSFSVYCVGGSHPLVRRNTIVDAGDCGIYSFGSTPNCRNNVIVGSENFGIACFLPGAPTLGCNVLFDNVNADYSPECTPGASDQHADPRFCDTTTFTLFSDSPCTAANAGACGPIGAVDEICALLE